MRQPATLVGTSDAPAAVEVPTGATDTRVYFRPVGFNGLARAVPTAATRWSCNLPLGAPVVAVMLQVRGSQLYYGTQAITTQANQVVRPPLEALSKAEIVRRIRLLSSVQRAGNHHVAHRVFAQPVRDFGHAAHA